MTNSCFFGPFRVSPDPFAGPADRKERCAAAMRFPWNVSVSVSGGFNLPRFSGKRDASALVPTRLGKLLLDIGVDLRCPLACFPGKTRLAGSLHPGAREDVRDIIIRHAMDVLPPVSRE
ncbi:hypothetical protein [Aurantimonas coralicida]|uniref:hypothetical protein n=1 Tax=Aurantimonas coralicida TaxID=182270 RepID=UPI001D18198D|nr:hypothetical protein [Aurantimonas coralicida]MCC4300064.1 hypothetical protein [Aurantimonas coralicida]